MQQTRLFPVAFFFLVLLPVVGFSFPSEFHHTGQGGFFQVTLDEADLNLEGHLRIQAEPDDTNLFGLQLIGGGVAPVKVLASPKRCKTDLRVLLGAIEMYNMDVPKPLDELNPEVVSELVQKGYLHHSPESMQAGCVYRNRGKLSADGHLYCETHGGLNDEPGVSRPKKLSAGVPEKRSLKMIGRFRRSGEGRFRLVQSPDEKVIFKGKMEIPAGSQTHPGIEKEWRKFDSFTLSWYSLKCPGESVFSYILNQNDRRTSSGSSAPFDRADGRRRDPGSIPDLYSLTTGASAIQESLQLERMNNPEAKREPQTLRVKALSGPQVKSHPFKSMIGTKSPMIYPIDRLVPENFYSLHFSSISSEIAFSDLMDQWGSGLLQTLEVSARDGRIKEKLLTQLCLEMSELTRLFGDRVIDDLTICGADPFLQDGTDVSVIFHVKNAAVFDLNIAQKRTAAKSEFPKATEEKSTIEGVEVLALKTPDRRLHSLSCTVGEFKVFSNSRSALEKIIQAARERIPSLATSDDYRYMRTIFPADPAREEGFCYLSDSHIRQLVGPVWKIGRQRRLQCANSLKMIQNAISYYYHEEDPRPLTMEHLLRERYLEASYLFCPDKGAYRLDDKTHEPFCSIHGRGRLFVPILDIPPDMITNEEDEQYRRFVEEYNRYWTKFFDPVGIRFRLASSGVTLETCILPLIENSVYDSFRKICGSDPVPLRFPQHPSLIFRLMAKLDLGNVFAWESRFEQSIRDMVQFTSLSYGDFVDSLGDGVSMNVVDSDPKFTFDNPGRDTFLFDITRDFLGAMAGGFLLTSLNMPVYVAVNLRDEGKIEKWLGEFLSMIATREEERNRRQSFLSIQTFYYGTQAPDGGPKIHTFDIQFVLIRFHLFFSVFDGNLFIANKRHLIQEIFRNRQNPGQAEGNLAFHVFYDSFRQIAETSRLTWQEKMRQVCLNNHGVLFALARFRHSEPGDWARHSTLVNGFSPFCPAGGNYGFNEKKKMVQCSVHGDLNQPTQPFEPDPANSLNRFIEKLQRLGATLSVTPEGIMTKIELIY